MVAVAAVLGLSLLVVVAHARSGYKSSKVSDLTSCRIVRHSLIVVCLDYLTDCIRELFTYKHYSEANIIGFWLVRVQFVL